MISVCLAARNENDIYETVSSFYNTAFSPKEIEFCIVDDASENAITIEKFDKKIRDAIKIVRNKTNKGVAYSRNKACHIAEGEIFFISDSHVRISKGWDQALKQFIGDKHILTFTVRSLHDGKADLFGSSFIYPSLGTLWNRHQIFMDNLCHVACFPATAITRKAFYDIGCLDEGFKLYGAIEPEFSIRAWLFGYLIVHSSAITVWHRFKEDESRINFLKAMDFDFHYNYIRLGFLYGDHIHQAKMLGHWRNKFPSKFDFVIAKIDFDEITRRRKWLEERSILTFNALMSGFGFAVSDSMTSQNPTLAMCKKLS